MKQQPQRRTIRRQAFHLTLFSLIGVLLSMSYQNCAGSFAPILASPHIEASVMTPEPRSTTDEPRSTTGEPRSTTGEPRSTTDEPRSTTDESPPVLEQTVFYFGRARALDSIALDHATGTVKMNPSVPFAGSSAGWLAVEPVSKTLFVADEGTNAKLHAYDIAADGRLTSKGSLDFLAGIVHLSVELTASGYNFYGANYNEGTLSYYRAPTGLAKAEKVQTLGFGGNAKTHSSSLDRARKLLYVASLGLNKISVYSLASTSASLVAEIALPNPRTVVYDAIYDKVYVSTESYAGASYIKGYSIQVTNSAGTGGYSFT